MIIMMEPEAVGPRRKRFQRRAWMVPTVMAAAMIAVPAAADDGLPGARWYTPADTFGTCRDVAPPADRVRQLHASGDAEAKAIPLPSDASMPPSRPARVTIRRTFGPAELYFRSLADCIGTWAPPRRW